MLQVLLAEREYIRKAVLKEPVPQLRKRQRVPEVNRLIYVELGQIGSNINRIADACQIALERGQGCNIDADTLQILSQKLDEIRLELLAVNSNSDDDGDTE